MPKYLQYKDLKKQFINDYERVMLKDEDSLSDWTRSKFDQVERLYKYDYISKYTRCNLNKLIVAIFRGKI